MLTSIVCSGVVVRKVLVLDSIVRLRGQESIIIVLIVVIHSTVPVCGVGEVSIMLEVMTHFGKLGAHATLHELETVADLWGSLLRIKGLEWSRIRVHCTGTGLVSSCITLHLRIGSKENLLFGIIVVVFKMRHLGHIL